MTPGYSLVRPTTVEICARFFSRLLPSQIPWMTFRPDLGGQRRNLVETVLDRIGAHAIGYFGELRQILRRSVPAAMWVVGNSGVWSPRNGA